jgi:hypothetical protein
LEPLNREQRKHKQTNTMKGKRSMKNKLMTGYFADGMNFKRPCWLALFASLGMLLAGYGAFYGMFPYGHAGQVQAVNVWQMLMENGLFLLMVVGAFGFVASLTWWFVAAIKFRFRGSRPRSFVAVSALSGVGLAAFLCLCTGNLQAQDDNGGGPGGPPPGQPGDGGPGGPGDSGGPGGPAGPPPGDFGDGGPGGPGGGFDPAQFQQRIMEQIRRSLNVTNDDEWAVIQPLVQKVTDTRREAGGGGGMGMPGPGGPGGRGRPGAQASSEQQALQKAIDDGAPMPQIKDALAKCRGARKDKQAKLEAAQTNLKKVLSIKQEAQAVLLGLLP